METVARTDEFLAREARCIALAEEAPTTALRGLWLEEARLWRLMGEQAAAFDRTVDGIRAAFAEASGGAPDGQDS